MLAQDNIYTKTRSPFHHPDRPTTSLVSRNIMEWQHCEVFVKARKKDFTDLVGVCLAKTWTGLVCTACAVGCMPLMKLILAGARAISQHPQNDRPFCSQRPTGEQTNWRSEILPKIITQDSVCDRPSHRCHPHDRQLPQTPTQRSPCLCASDRPNSAHAL